MTYTFGTHDANTLEQMRDVAERAEYTALMADGHLGYIMPIGGVAAYDNEVSVAGVGFDIACGNAAIRTGVPIHEVLLHRLADEIQSVISFGVGGVNDATDAPTDVPLFEGRDEWSIIPRAKRQSLMDRARNQLGTVGSGNHYVDVFTDAAGYTWVGVHFGSRGFGWNVAMGFMALTQGESWGTRVKEEEALLSLDTQIGQDYWALMSLAGEYAYAGRRWVCRKVVDMFGGEELELVHNNHNFAWKEVHFGRDMVVVRKGATPAFPGQLGFVGGSMGDDSVILRGAGGDTPTQRQALYSTVHGAGRVMSRSQAKGKWNRKTGEIKKPGLVSPEMMNGWLEEKGVILRGGGLDESPHAYRRLPDVLEAQGGTVEVLHTLTPRVVVMAE